jgi:hypothetical protein
MIKETAFSYISYNLLANHINSHTDTCMCIYIYTDIIIKKLWQSMIINKL